MHSKCSPAKETFHFGNLHHQSDNTYSVHELCEALDVARGTFYNHIFRRADRSQRDQEQTQLMRLVQQAFDDSGQRYGAEKIRITLAEGGIRVSTKRIATIMQELDLRSIRLDSKKQFKKHQKYRKQNLLEQQFTAEHPNQTWVSDITYFKLNDYWLYLCIISRPLFPENHRLSRIPQCQHEFGHQYISDSFPRTRYPCRFDISQRPRQAVYFHRIYNAPAKVRCEAIVFRYGTAT